MHATAENADETAAYMRTYRARRKANGGRPLRVPGAVAAPVEVPTVWPADVAADPAGAVAAWAAAKLVVPPGHALSGRPMELPPFAVAFLRDALAPGVREAGLLVSRKNLKSAACAVLILAHLVGPLCRAGWRAGIASVTREKSGELKAQIEAIALASGLDGLTMRRSPAPGRVDGPGGRVEFLSADRNSGHASGFDIAFIDELGLLSERDRPLVEGMLSSVSAKNGRMLSISIVGDAPFTSELIARADDPSVVVHLHQAPADCALGDESAWHLANPALACGIKSIDYMRDMSRRAQMLPNSASTFRAHDLNQPQSPSREMLCGLDSWRACEVEAEDLPPREGACVIGFDLGGSCSMTAAAVFWPETNRLEVFGAFGNLPDLKARGEADGVGERYERMLERGELRTFAGRVTPVSEFLAWLAGELEGQTVAAAAADRYRQSEALDALSDANVAWPMVWRASGAGPNGGEDIRALQDAIEGGKLRSRPSLLLASAIAGSLVRRDPNGNPGLDKSKQKSRIDALSATVLAVGLGRRHLARPPQEVTTFAIPLSAL